MKFNLKDLAVGDCVVVDEIYKGYITSVEENINNKIPGINFKTESNLMLWCYLDHITSHTPMEQKVIYRPSFEDVEVGDHVVCSAWAGDPDRKGIISDVSSTLKNDSPGIVYETEKEGTCWAYADQIKQITKYVAKETITPKKPKM